MNILNPLESSYWIMSIKTDVTPSIVEKIDKITNTCRIDNTSELMSNYHNRTVLITDSYTTVSDFITTNNINLNGNTIPE